MMIIGWAYNEDGIYIGSIKNNGKIKCKKSKPILIKMHNCEEN
jgi:hypothetical protein